jgi:hypothetical protein
MGSTFSLQMSTVKRTTEHKEQGEREEKRAQCNGQKQAQHFLRAGSFAPGIRSGGFSPETGAKSRLLTV